MVTRSEFESECAGLFARVLGPVEDLLNEALMPRSEIDEVRGGGGDWRRRGRLAGSAAVPCF